MNTRSLALVVLLLPACPQPEATPDAGTAIFDCVVDFTCEDGQVSHIEGTYCGARDDALVHIAEYEELCRTRGFCPGDAVGLDCVGSCPAVADDEECFLDDCGGDPARLRAGEAHCAD